MSQLQATVETFEHDGSNEVMLQFKGRIEASTIKTFQDSIDEQIDGGALHLILDLGGVEYITSTGLGGLVKYFNLMTEKGGGFALITPPPAVLDVLQLLGLEAILPMIDQIEDYASGDQPTGSEAVAQVEDEMTAQQRLSMIRAEATAGNVDAEQADQRESTEVPVVLAVPEVELFSLLVADQLQESGVKVVIATTADEAYQAITREKAAAVVVDFMLPDYASLCRKIKLSPKTSTCSIILIYEEGESPDNVKGLSILPNEHVVEPFPIDKLANLAKSEIERKKSEASFIRHELQFRFPSNLKWIDRANKIMEKILEVPFGKSKDQYLAIKSSVREAIDNANRHGNKENSKNTIDVAYILDKEKATISIRDCGTGFDYEQYLESIEGKAAAELAERRDFDSLGGLGIALMRKCCDELSFNKRGNEVTQIKYLKPPA